MRRRAWARREAWLPNCVPLLAGEYGFMVDCIAQCENILSVELSRLDLEGVSRGYTLAPEQQSAWRLQLPVLRATLEELVPRPNPR